MKFQVTTINPVNMKCVLLVLYLHLAQNLSLPFDLPKPLDRFYDEVVRFYKRVKHEGGKLIKYIAFSNRVWLHSIKVESL